MSAERKYDGEYCQVHIDLGENKSGIKVFSKSGKDSSNDRIGLHGALRENLKLGTTHCPIKKRENCWFGMIRSSESSPSRKSANRYSDLVVLWGTAQDSP